VNERPEGTEPEPGQTPDRSGPVIIDRDLFGPGRDSEREPELAAPEPEPERAAEPEREPELAAEAEPERAAPVESVAHAEAEVAVEPLVLADRGGDLDHVGDEGLSDDSRPADVSGAQPGVTENPLLTLIDPAPDSTDAERVEDESPAARDEEVVQQPPSRPVPTEKVRLLVEALRRALEAIMLVVDEPVAEELLAQVLERPREEVVAGLESLSAEYTASGRGFDLRRAAGGWRLYTREEFAPFVERFVLDGQQARLTQAALETLAVVAYKQPVTRSRISAIRGVAVDGVIRTLLTRGMIEECGAEPDTGAHLYRTTTLFLEKLGLDSIDELPALAPLLPDLDTLDDVISAS